MAFTLPGGRTIAVVAVGVLAGTLFTTGGSAVASSAGADVHACVNKKTRYARIVNPTTVCRTTEIRVTWGDGNSQPRGVNTAGPQGPAGRTGAQGPAGPKGEQGFRGAPGRNGRDGAAGPKGEPGLRGAPGQDGAKGEAGAQGPAGPAGPKGEQGLRGAPGQDGKDGAAGPRGEQGLRGAPGQDGAKGATGAQGPAGPAGPKGEPGTGGSVKIGSDSESFSFSGDGTKQVSCGSGEVATGGGYSLSQVKGNVLVTASAPTFSGKKPSGWTVSIDVNSNSGNGVAANSAPTSSPSATPNANNQLTTGGQSGSRITGTVYVICAAA
ncbi:hypothetical protein [Streptosporangium sp. NBC_01756]|uniref:hypothetical protein n=1 Tax=Streptosporangium sp. NBC_01756 TaxID=2975950 RepID=UPI002DDA60FA|nr:hypothetical protein [Streptosporangium sp. NBC_01756]WSC89844.1 hypothetical protein OIE48_17165 [Streptosporangium sp. NBC_01756]